MQQANESQSNPTGDPDQAVATPVDTAEYEVDSTTRRIEMLQRSAAIGQLTASAVHDIRNSLSSMALIGDALDAAFGPDERVDLLRREVRNTLDLLRSISSFARPQPEPEDDHDDLEFSVSALIEQTTALLHIVIPAGTELHIDIETRSVFPAIEPREFQQVILNLVLNARDATAGQRGAIAITAMPTPNDPSHADICVADNGSGMSKEDLDRAFEPYFTTKGDAGTGLGLPICREIVERHGGALLAESALGNGSTFTIRLPVT